MKPVNRVVLVRSDLFFNKSEDNTIDYKLHRLDYNDNYDKNVFFLNKELEIEKIKILAEEKVVHIPLPIISPKNMMNEEELFFKLLDASIPKENILKIQVNDLDNTLVRGYALKFETNISLYSNIIVHTGIEKLMQSWEEYQPFSFNSSANSCLTSRFNIHARTTCSLDSVYILDIPTKIGHIITDRNSVAMIIENPNSIYKLQLPIVNIVKPLMKTIVFTEDL